MNFEQFNDEDFEEFPRSMINTLKYLLNTYWLLFNVYNLCAIMINCLFKFSKTKLKII